MSWSLRIARVSGIDIKVHPTFVFILVLGAMQWGRPHGLDGAVFGVLLMLGLFTCVTLHELGHALVAQRFHALVHAGLRILLDVVDHGRLRSIA